MSPAVVLALVHLEFADGLGLHYGSHPTVEELLAFECQVRATLPLYRSASGYRVSFDDVWADAAFESRFHKTDWDRLRGPRADRYCQATGYFGMHPNFYHRHARRAGYGSPERETGESTKSHALRLTAHIRADLARELRVHALGMASFLKACRGDYPCAVSYYRHGYIGSPDALATAKAYRNLRTKMAASLSVAR